MEPAVASLLVISGPTLSGKSSLAAAIAAQHGWIPLEMDRVLDDIRPGSGHQLDDRKAGYRAMHDRAAAYIAQKQRVIVDCTYSRRSYREDLLRVGSLVTALVECRVTESTAMERFAARSNHPAVDLTGAGVARSIFNFQYSGLGIELDESDSLQARIARTLELANRGPFLDIQRWIEYGR